MPRRRMRMGEVGTIRIVVLANGQIQANARMRDEVGALCRLKVARASEEDARRALAEQADLIRHGSAGPTLNAYSTIAEAGAVFLDDKRRSETVEVSTIETYEYSVNNVIIPECGDLQLTVERVWCVRCSVVSRRSVRHSPRATAPRTLAIAVAVVLAPGMGVADFD